MSSISTLAPSISNPLIETEALEAGRIRTLLEAPSFDLSTGIVCGPYVRQPEPILGHLRRRYKRVNTLSGLATNVSLT